MALSLSPAAREKLKDILVCFSLGNLCFVRRWYDLEILQETSLDYLRPGPASPVVPSASLLTVCPLCTAQATSESPSPFASSPPDP